MKIEHAAAIGMRNDQLRAETISHNVANALTPGFKSSVAIPGAFALEVAQAGAAPALIAHAPVAHSAVINAAAGAMKVTGLPTDIAVEGNAWLEVEGPQGSLYTRSGALRIDQAGRLVGPQNLPVMGEAGQIRLQNGPFSITSAGDVMQGGEAVARLRRVEFDKPGELEPRGAGLYAQGRALVIEAQSAAPVRSGVLEASNVNTAYEMVRLSETVRHFESLRKIVQGYDDTLEKTIRKLGEF